MRHTDVRYAVKMWCLCVALPCLALCIIGVLATVAEGAGYTPTKPHGSGAYVSTEGRAITDCFPAASWDGIDLERPCTTVTRPQEDGSGRLLLGTASSILAACIIPNPYEERGTFALKCQRFAGRMLYAKQGRVVQAPGAEICFRAADWNANPENRPCDIVGRPYEDGSGRLYLGTAGADAAYCNVPNVHEERGHFGVSCRRVANR